MVFWDLLSTQMPKEGTWTTFGILKTTDLSIELLSLSVLLDQLWMTNLMPHLEEWTLSKSSEVLKASEKCQQLLTDHSGPNLPSNGHLKVREWDMDQIHLLELVVNILTLQSSIQEAQTLVSQRKCSKISKKHGARIFMIWIASLMIISAKWWPLALTSHQSSSQLVSPSEAKPSKWAQVFISIKLRVRDANSPFTQTNLREAPEP